MCSVVSFTGGRNDEGGERREDPDSSDVGRERDQPRRDTRQITAAPRTRRDVNPLGIKGLGEIGLVGVAAAIAIAIYHPTGKRVCDLPVILDKLL